MKLLLFVLALLANAGSALYAQCQGKLNLTASNTEYLDSAGTIQKIVPEKTVVTITSAEINIAPGYSSPMTGTILSSTCSWKIPFKEGKSVIKTLLTDESGDKKDVTFTIEGKDGKITFFAEVKDMPNKKIRLTADTFLEKK